MFLSLTPPSWKTSRCSALSRNLKSTSHKAIRPVRIDRTARPDYLCGENGAGLSGGERQRISIARSLLRKSRVLLADEITAALDAETAKQVSNAVLSLEELTRIVVTHKLDPALAQYDCIVVLKAGRIVQSGSFDALMASKDYFYSLYTVSQS
jgi:ABC-type multidrug transport system fused ATPase/permease subunit